MNSSEVEEEEEDGGEREWRCGPTRYLRGGPRRLALGFPSASFSQSHRERKRLFLKAVGVGLANGCPSSPRGERNRLLPGHGQRLGQGGSGLFCPPGSRRVLNLHESLQPHSGSRVNQTKFFTPFRTRRNPVSRNEAVTSRPSRPMEVAESRKKETVTR